MELTVGVVYPMALTLSVLMYSVFTCIGSIALYGHTTYCFSVYLLNTLSCNTVNRMVISVFRINLHNRDVSLKIVSLFSHI